MPTFLVEPLTELTDLVKDFFSPVLNRHIPVAEFPEHPLSDKELQVSTTGLCCMNAIPHTVKSVYNLMIACVGVRTNLMYNTKFVCTPT